MPLIYDDSQIQTLLRNSQSRLGPYVEDILRKIGLAILSKIQMNMSGRILQKRSGRLFDSWGMNIAPSGQNEIELKISSDSPYGEIHDKGGMTGRGHKTRIPARYYYSKTPDDVLSRVDNMIKAKLDKIWQ